MTWMTGSKYAVSREEAAEVDSGVVQRSTSPLPDILSKGMYMFSSYKIQTDRAKLLIFWILANKGKC